MRTTITLDADVFALVQRDMAERGLPFEDAVNSALRTALAPSPPGAQTELPVFDLGESRVPLEQALRLAAELEDEELAREYAVSR